MEAKDFDKITQLKLFLLDKFGIADDLKTIDFCKEAYKFIMDGDMLQIVGLETKTGMPVAKRVFGMNMDEKGNVQMHGEIPPYMSIQLKDGVYLIYEQRDGDKINRWCEPFDGTNSKEYAVAVAFKFGQVSLTLYRNNIRGCKMTTEKDGDSANYITSYAQAAHDFNGKRWTELLIKRKLSCAGQLPFEYPEWYIPAIGELYVMFLMKTYINDALEYIGAEPLEDKWYWSSTEYSATGAWYLLFNGGGFGNYRKTYKGLVRPVSAFAPLSL